MIFLSYHAFKHLKTNDYISALIEKSKIEIDDLPVLENFSYKILIFCLKYGLVMDYDFENLLTKIRSFYLNYDQQINININTHIFI